MRDGQVELTLRFCLNHVSKSAGDARMHGLA